jgi:TRAP transporter 4TM/12TM fusion protein
MGAIAFVMAEWIEVPYAEVALAALIPALLYYLVVFASVHLQALKYGIKAMPRADLPRLGLVMREGWHYLLPIAVLIWLLIVEALPPGMAAMWSIIATIAGSFLSRDRGNWLTPRRIMLAFEDGVRRWVIVAAITGSVGIMIGALELSGVGIKLSAFIIDLAGGNLYLALFLVGFASLIVGMGLDSIPSYITLATLMAPALIDLGVPVKAAHLFVVYWGLASFYTPPMCIAVYVAIGIAGSKVWATGGEAVRIGIAAFLIPFAFAINRGLMLDSTLGHIVLATSTAVIGAVLIACAVQGYLLREAGVIERIALFAAGVLFILPGFQLPLIGLAILAMVVAIQRFVRRPLPAATGGE